VSLQIRVAVEDIQAVCSYLVTKPTGATAKETAAVLDKTHLDPRKLAAMKEWDLLSELDGKYKITEKGREFVRSNVGKTKKGNTGLYLLKDRFARCERHKSVENTETGPHH
jgi:hypothetical protein